jgi:hypothetical protein
MVDVVRQKPMSILHPYTVEVYVAVDGSEACLSLTSSNAFCARNGTVREVKLELEFKRYKTHEDKMREVQTKGPAGIHHGGEGVREDTPAPKTASMRQIQTTETISRQ